VRSIGADPAAVGQRLNALLFAQAPLAPVLYRPGRQEPPRSIKFLDASVPSFGHIYRAVWPDCDPRRVLKFARFLATPPEIADVYPVRSISADAVRTCVGDEDIALVVNHDPARRPEPVWRGVDEVARRLPPRQDWRQIRREFLDAVVPGVGNVYIAGRVHRDIGRLVELPGCCTRSANRRQRSATRIEFLDPRVAAIDDVDIARCVQRQAKRQ